MCNTAAFLFPMAKHRSPELSISDVIDQADALALIPGGERDAEAVANVLPSEIRTIRVQRYRTMTELRQVIRSGNKKYMESIGFEKKLGLLTIEQEEQIRREMKSPELATIRVVPTILGIQNQTVARTNEIIPVRHSAKAALRNGSDVEKPKVKVKSRSQVFEELRQKHPGPRDLSIILHNSRDRYEGQSFLEELEEKAEGKGVKFTENEKKVIRCIKQSGMFCQKSHLPGSLYHRDIREAFAGLRKKLPKIGYEFCERENHTIAIMEKATRKKK